MKALILDTIGRLSGDLPVLSIGRLKSELFPCTIDNALWSLAMAGEVHLYRHDFPKGMPPADRFGCLVRAGQYFNAVSLCGNKVRPTVLLATSLQADRKLAIMREQTR